MKQVSLKPDEFFKDENQPSLSKGIEWLERKGFERDNFSFYRKIAVIEGRTFEFVMGGNVEFGAAVWSGLVWVSHGDFMYKVFWGKSKDLDQLMEKALAKAVQVAGLEEKDFLEEIEKDKGLEPWTE